MTCRSLAGERPISPGPRIHDGRFWIVDHAYPTKLAGWLVLVLKRHAEALHDLTSEEFRELADLQARTAKVLHATLNCEKEYLACFAEGAGFSHVHIHVVPRPRDLPRELKGPRIFAMLTEGAADAIPPDEVRVLCERLRDRFAGGP